jgi:rifampin ADP-ribosylating transferase
LQWDKAAASKTASEDQGQRKSPHTMSKENNKDEPLDINAAATPFAQTYFHGTKVDLQVGELIEAGFSSNFGSRTNSQYIFMTATLDAAIWGAELAIGEGRERIYVVEPTGDIEDDPDLTDRKFHGNPTMSYRSVYPLKIIGEVINWNGHSVEQVQAMKDALDKLKEQGVQSLNDS